MAKDLQMSLLLDFYGSMLSEKQRELTSLYYNEDLSLGEISEDIGITRQGVRDSIKRSECQLIEFEDKLHLVKKYHNTKHTLTKMNDIIKNLEKYNNSDIKNETFSENIMQLKNLIEQIVDNN